MTRVLTQPHSSDDLVQNGPPKPLILHISGDYPDPVNGAKTPVIKTLLELTEDRFNHSVISINRQTPAPSQWARIVRTNVDEERPFDGGTALRYLAPPRGVLHRTMLLKLAEHIVRRISAMPTRPQLLVGHKLTIEGIVVQEAARRLGLPYALCIQGNTDCKILNIRPDLRKAIKSVYHDARVVFPFTPWALSNMEKRLGARQGPTHLLPCPTELDEPLEPELSKHGLVTVFHLRNYKGKNLAGIARAFSVLASRKEDLPHLAVVGGGSEFEVAACRKLTREFPQISYSGPQSRSAVREILHDAKAMILPSLRESFGLVFIEALFAGTPIIYPQGTAVDGYFEGRPFAIKVKASDPRAIADAIAFANANEKALKDELRLWLLSPDAKRFTRGHIAAVFAGGLEQACASS